MALTGSHALGDTGRIADDNLRDVSINANTAAIATKTTPADASAAAAVLIAAEHSTERAYQSSTFARARQVDAKVYGATGDGVTDDTTAIQAAINAASAGDTIYFPPTGPSAFYKITAKLTVTTANIRFASGGRDYATQIKCTTASTTMIEVKAPGFVLDQVMLVGDGGVNGAGATVNGIDMFGDTGANQDCTISGSFIYLTEGVRLRGKNGDVYQALFSNCLQGVVMDGTDGTYHVAGAGDDKRGNQVRESRFHNIGTSGSHAAVAATNSAKIVHAQIRDNFFDSGGGGLHIHLDGTAGNPNNRVVITGNVHRESTSDAIFLTYCLNSVIDGEKISGVGSGWGNRGLVLTNCTDLAIRDVSILQVGNSGVYARSCTGLTLDGITVRAIGFEATTTGHGFDIDSTNSQCSFDGIKVNGADGWGFLGSPTDSKFGTHEFRSCTLGRISSTTFGVESIWIPAVDMTITTGTPNLAALPGVGYPASWQLDSASTEQLSMQVPDTPNTWGAFDIVIWWAVTNTFTGNVVFDLTRAIMSAGVVVGVGGVSVGPLVAASPAVAGQLVATTMAAGVTRAPGPLHIRMDRAGANASDTYAADAAVVAVQLVRVT